MTGALWYYFGCGKHTTGHYLHDRHGVKPRGLARVESYLERRFDGVLPPHPERDYGLYQATVTVFPGMGYTALAWWDRSADSRPGSNSVIWAPGTDWQPEALVNEARALFPWVFERLPRPLLLWPA